MFVIEITTAHPKMWVTSGEGDPPRTYKIENAQTFRFKELAIKRINAVKEMHPFRKVEYKIVEL